MTLSFLISDSNVIIRTGNTAHQKARPDMGLPAWESAQKMEQATGKVSCYFFLMTAEFCISCFCLTGPCTEEIYREDPVP